MTNTDILVDRSVKPSSDRLRALGSWCLYSTLMAVGYFLAGRLGQLLAVPPSYATAIWPASGIALAGLLLGGYRVGLGLFLGALMVNGWTPLSSATSVQEAMSTLLVPTSISIGATAQALLGAFLIRRYVGFPNALIQDVTVLKFLMLGGPLACLVGASAGVATLTFVGAMEASQIALNWSTWWVGDVIGVIIFAPLMLIYCAKPREVWRPRRLSVALPLSAAFAVTIIGFMSTQVLEQSAARPRFDKIAANSLERLQEQLLAHLDALHAVESFYASSTGITRSEFASFNRHALNRHRGLRAIAWLPVVTQDERSEVEARASADGLPDFRLSERSFDQQLVAAGERDRYLPVSYLEPQRTSVIPLGFDVASNRQWRDASSRCCDTGRPVATRPIRYAGRQDPPYVLVFAPVFAHGDHPTTVGERRKSLRGFVLGAYDVGQIVAVALPENDSNDSRVSIVDESVAPGVLVYSQTQVASPHKASEVASMLRQRFEKSTTIEMAGRKWRCDFKPTSGFYAAQANRHTWLILACGLSLTALLGGSSF